MRRQVITIDQNGIMSGLQVKPGKGIDLRQFGDASIKRASDIEWDETVQAWTVRLLTTRWKGELLTYQRAAEYLSLSDLAGMIACAEPDAGNMEQPVRCRDYDDAVSVEIAFFNGLRLREGSAACG